MKKSTTSYLTLILILFSFGISAQITITGSNSQDGTYLLTGNTTGVGLFDAGTNYYTATVNGPGLLINQIVKRENNFWQHRLYVQSASPTLNYQTHKLVLPSTSNETNPPCGGVWETTDQLGNGTGTFLYITITGTCSTVNNPPPPRLAGTTTPFGYLLPAFYDFDISSIPSPLAGQMIWDITNACVKVYDGTTWNCI